MKAEQRLAVLLLADQPATLQRAEAVGQGLQAAAYPVQVLRLPAAPLAGWDLVEAGVAQLAYTHGPVAVFGFGLSGVIGLRALAVMPQVQRGGVIAPVPLTAEMQPFYAGLAPLLPSLAKPVLVVAGADAPLATALTHTLPAAQTATAPASTQLTLLIKEFLRKEYEGQL